MREEKFKFLESNENENTTKNKYRDSSKKQN
jgi:hypothetical protein